jgi:hypothetical protein
MQSRLGPNGISSVTVLDRNGRINRYSSTCRNIEHFLFPNCSWKVRIVVADRGTRTDKQSRKVPLIRDSTSFDNYFVNEKHCPGVRALSLTRSSAPKNRSFVTDATTTLATSLNFREPFLPRLNFLPHAHIFGCLLDGVPAALTTTQPSDYSPIIQISTSMILSKLGI